MKILLLANKISWISELNKKVEKVKKFFTPLGDFEFIIEKTDYLNLPLSEYDNGTGGKFKSVDESWYDLNISIPAKNRGFDMVALLLRPEEWSSGLIQGLGTPTDCGIEEMIILANKKGHYNFLGVPENGDQLVNIIQHEILHRLYDFYKLQDNTHKWYLLGTPDKCLEEIKAGQTPRLQAILVRQEQAKETLGTLIATKNGDFLMCKTLELPDLNNAIDKSSIPRGTYEVKWTFSPKFQKFTYEIINVLNRPGIRIHSGNYVTDTEGCILLGDSYGDLNKDGLPDILNSKVTVKKLEDFFNQQSFTLIIV